MAECDTVVSQIAQRLTVDQGIDRVGWLMTHIQHVDLRKRRFRQNAKQPGPVSVVIVKFSIGRLPPLFGHVDLSAQDRSIPWPAGKAGETKEVPRHIARGVSIGQEWGEVRSSVSDFLNLGLT